MNFLKLREIKMWLGFGGAISLISLLSQTGDIWGGHGGCGIINPEMRGKIKSID
jgi:hypothetical protein